MVLACYPLQKKFLYALVDLEVLVKSGVNTLCRHISCHAIHVAEILLWCGRKVMCTTVSYFLPHGSSSFSWQLWLGDCIHFAFTCTNVIVSNLSRDNILFSTFIQVCFYFLEKKTGGDPPLATALTCELWSIFNDWWKKKKNWGSPVTCTNSLYKTAYLACPTVVLKYHLYYYACKYVISCYISVHFP